MLHSKSNAIEISKIAAFYIFAGLLGVLIAFHPMVLSGFTKLQAETQDTRLLNYFLEHSFQFVFNRNYHAGLWSPTFFFPYPGALAFSENLFGVAPLYWLPRAFFPPDISYQLWLIACAFLCFICFAIFCRSFRVSHILSAFGGFIFGFGLLKTGHLMHAHLLPQFFTPLAFLLVWKFFRQPTKTRLGLALFLIFLQIASSIYLGWFLLFSLLIFIPLLFYFDRATAKAAVEFIQTKWKFAIAAIAVWLVAVSVLLSPYLAIAKLIGPRPYSEVRSMLPRLSSWLSPPPKSLWYSSLVSFANDQPISMRHEHWIFMGFTVFVLVGFAIYILRSKQSVLSDERAVLVKTCLATAFTIVVLSLYVFGFSLWRLIYAFVPGATAIRGVSRIALIVEFFLLVASVVSLDSFLKHSSFKRRVSVIALLIFLFSIPENIIAEPTFYSRAAILKTEAELQELMRQGCDVAYVNSEASEDLTPQVNAMWAGLAAGVPVINGYSGLQPPTLGQRVETMSFSNLMQWLQSSKFAGSGRFCLLASTADPLTATRQLEAGISLDSIRSSTQYFSSGRNYTALVVPLPSGASLPDYAQEIRTADQPTVLSANQAIELPVFVRNPSRSTWIQSAKVPFNLSYRWLDSANELDSGDGVRSPLPTVMPPGKVVALNAAIKAPTRPGQYTLRLSVVQEDATWFFERGAKPLDLPITVIR